MSQLAKILAVNEVGTVNGLFQKFDPKLGINKKIRKYIYLTVEYKTQKPMVGNT